MEIRRASLDEILPLRHAVLIVGTDRVSPEFPGDRDPATRHFGVFDEGRNLACTTLMVAEWQERPAWQLRGMATDPEHRGRGIGAALLAFVEDDLRCDSDVHFLWCNARAGAVGFYERHGWRIASDEFNIAGVGPHRKMTKTLSPGTASRELGDIGQG